MKMNRLMIVGLTTFVLSINSSAHAASSMGGFYDFQCTAVIKLELERSKLTQEAEKIRSDRTILSRMLIAATTFKQKKQIENALARLEVKAQKNQDRYTDWLIKYNDLRRDLATSSQITPEEALKRCRTMGSNSPTTYISQD